MTANVSVDGWIKWDGSGEPPSGKVIIRLRDGTEWRPSDEELAKLDWRHTALDPSGDIIAYCHT